MANDQHLATFHTGVESWNAWRRENPAIRPDLSGARLSRRLDGADLRGIDLRRANLVEAHLRGADLRDADLRGAGLTEAHLNGANLAGADLSGANLLNTFLSETDLTGANLSDAVLGGAFLRKCNLNGANLRGSALSMARLVDCSLEGADLSDCRVYGISAWNLRLAGARQNNLLITPPDEPAITVDNIEVAQFVYLLLHNEKVRDVISTITSKAVLVLGRFSIPERMAVLDGVKDELRRLGYLPIVFDFERPPGKDFTETILTLAGMALFVVADITNPRSSPLELQATIPNYMTPFVPIIQEGEEPFSMFADLQTKHRDWVLDVVVYDTQARLIQAFEAAIVGPALQRREELAARKGEGVRTTHISAFLGAKAPAKKPSKKPAPAPEKKRRRP